MSTRIFQEGTSSLQNDETLRMEGKGRGAEGAEGCEGEGVEEEREGNMAQVHGSIGSKKFHTHLIILYINFTPRRRRSMLK